MKAKFLRWDVKGKIIPMINVLSNDFDIDHEAEGQADVDEQLADDADGQLADDADEVGDDADAAMD